jgi:hypothetical protein
MTESETEPRRRSVALEDGTPYREEVSGFVDALESLLRERNLGSIGPSDIAHQANRTVALFFQCFKDERGPMSLLVSRMIADRLETSTASFAADRWRTASILEIVRSAVDYLVTLVRPDDPVSLAAAEVSANDRELMDLRRSALTFDIELFRRLLVSRAEEIPDVAGEAAIDLVARQVLVALDREMLLGQGDHDANVAELSDQLVDVTMRLLGLHSASPPLSQPTSDVAGDEARTPVVMLGGAEVSAILERAISEQGLALRVIRATSTDDAVVAVTNDDAVAVFCSWEDAEVATRELLHRVQGSAWLSSVVPVVLTSGSADELSMAYALGARVAVTTPTDPDGFVHLLGHLDKMLGVS